MSPRHTWVGRKLIRLTVGNGKPGAVVAAAATQCLCYTAAATKAWHRQERQKRKRGTNSLTDTINSRGTPHSINPNDR